MSEWVTKWGPQFYEQQNENWLRLAILVEVPTLAWVVGMAIDSFIPDRGQAPLGTGHLCVGRALTFLPLVVWWWCDDHYLKLYLPGRTGLKLGNWHFLSIGIPCVVAGVVCQLGVPPRHIDILFAAVQVLFLAVAIPCVFIGGRREIMRRWDAYCAAIGEMVRERRARMLREEAGQPEEQQSVWEPVNERRNTLPSKPFTSVDKTMLLIFSVLFIPVLGMMAGGGIEEANKGPRIGLGAVIGCGAGVVIAAILVGIVAQVKTHEDREREALKRDVQKPTISRREPATKPVTPKPVPAPVVVKPDPNADLKLEREQRLKELKAAAEDPESPLDEITIEAQRREIEADFQRKIAERKS